MFLDGRLSCCCCDWLLIWLLLLLRHLEFWKYYMFFSIFLFFKFYVNNGGVVGELLLEGDNICFYKIWQLQRLYCLINFLKVI